MDLPGEGSSAGDHEVRQIYKDNIGVVVPNLVQVISSPKPQKSSLSKASKLDSRPNRHVLKHGTQVGSQAVQTLPLRIAGTIEGVEALLLKPPGIIKGGQALPLRTAGIAKGGISDVPKMDLITKSRINTQKPCSISASDSKMDEVFPDPFNRPSDYPRQTETEIRENCEAILRKRGFKGAELISLLDRVMKPFKHKVYARKPGETIEEYLAAMSELIKGENASKKVEGYDEDSYYELVKSLYESYDLLYPDEPNPSSKATSSTANDTDQEAEEWEEYEVFEEWEEDGEDGEYEVDEDGEWTTMGGVACADGEVLKEKEEAMPARDSGFLTPPHDQMASAEEIEKWDQESRVRFDAAKKKRQDEEWEEFKRDAPHYATFSNGFVERWKEPDTTMDE